MRHDYDFLWSGTQSPEWSPDHPVSAEEFGPLWPNGAPAGLDEGALEGLWHIRSRRP
jgi:hypothetical protein